MMLGRPMMISPSATRHLALPNLTEDELPDVPARHSKTSGSYTAFFSQALKLVQVVGEVLDVLNAEATRESRPGHSSWTLFPNKSVGTTSRLVEQACLGDFQTILRLDAALTQWHDELPPYLKISISTGPRGGHEEIPESIAPILFRQAKVLQARCECNHDFTHGCHD